MQTRDIVYQRQPQPGTGYRARVIEAAKRHQRLVYLLVVNSRAAVFHACLLYTSHHQLPARFSNSRYLHQRG